MDFNIIHEMDHDMQAELLRLLVYRAEPQDATFKERVRFYRERMVELNENLAYVALNAADCKSIEFWYYERPVPRPDPTTLNYLKLTINGRVVDRPETPFRLQPRKRRWGMASVVPSNEEFEIRDSRTNELRLSLRAVKTPIPPALRTIDPERCILAQFG
jgi:hypothetical protein